MSTKFDSSTGDSHNLPGIGILLAAGIGVGALIGAIVAHMAKPDTHSSVLEAEALIERITRAAERSAQT
jgi:hypothetical protein